MKRFLIDLERFNFNLNNIKFSIPEDDRLSGWFSKGEFYKELLYNKKYTKFHDLIIFLRENDLGYLKTEIRDLFLNCTLSFELKEHWKKLLEDDIRKRKEDNRMNLQELVDYLDKNSFNYKVDFSDNFFITITFITESDDTVKMLLSYQLSDKDTFETVEEHKDIWITTN